MTHPSNKELDQVFGPASRGETLEERARTSQQLFVRSQSQLSLVRERATGPRMTANVALEVFGYSALREAVQEGAAVISANLNEPASTLREQRERLDVTIKQVSQASGLSPMDIENAEKPGAITAIRKLQRLAQVLGLDDELISINPSAEADQDLAVRLRTLKRPGQEVKLSAALVLKLTEAAWTISREAKLARRLQIFNRLRQEFEPSDNYGKHGEPAWQTGYDLAEKTRLKLGIDRVVPIRSVRKLIEEIGIPLIQEELGHTFAGATIENKKIRGLVVNVEGGNGNVWIRRMTLCHELGHLLWDPAARLHRLHVDKYDDLQKPGGPPVEARANAFAIAFLAPRDAVIEIVKSGEATASKVSLLMSRFGIASGAAKYHLANIARQWGQEIDTTRIRNALLPVPDQEWENDESWTVNYFPVRGVAIGRRGRFAGLVVAALDKGILTSDAAASCLNIPIADLEKNIDDIRNISTFK